MRKNPETKKLSGYYRLVENYRNHNGNVGVRTILSAGFLDELSVEQLNSIQKILTAKDRMVYKYSEETKKPCSSIMMGKVF